MLYNKGVVLAALEDEFGVDQGPDETDAMEVIDPQFGTDFSKLDRKIITGTKSNNVHSIGRKLATLQFQVEVKGSGVTNAGGKLGRLLQACDMTEVARTGADSFLLGYPVPFGHPAGKFTMVQTDAYTGLSLRRVLLTCVTPGGTGVAAFDVESPAVGNETAVVQAAKVMTNAVEFDWLPGGASFTPTITKDFEVGDKFVIYCCPAGYAYYPRTGDDAEDGHSLTLYCYYDGILHKLTGARGNWSMSAGAGEFGLFTFNFTGNYVDAEDEDIPEDLEFETTLPPQVEKARMWLPRVDGVEDQAICSAKFDFQMGNTIAPRRCVNDANGYAGAKVATRKPQFTADPEMVIEADHGFWELFETGAVYDVLAMIAEWDDNDNPTAGNCVAFVGPQAQTDAMPYANRDNTRVVNLTANLARVLEDDELIVFLG